jgi:hypothetical protein
MAGPIWILNDDSAPGRRGDSCFSANGAMFHRNLGSAPQETVRAKRQLLHYPLMGAYRE